MSTLCILIPAYNEAKRLPRTFGLIFDAMRTQGFAPFSVTEILVVDDGSTDSTVTVAESARTHAHYPLPQIRVVRVQPNAGKGNAIHSGLRATQADWVLIADADSATPWSQFAKLAVTGAPVAIGSRDLPESQIQVQQSWLRENLGRTFNLIVRTITGLSFRDTQCGFKMVQMSAIQPILHQLQVKRFAWDVELLMFAKHLGLRIVEVPVEWSHQDASRVNIIRDSIEMLIRVIQLRIRLCINPIKKID